MVKKKQNQDTDLDATLGTPKNSVEASDKVKLFNNNNKSEIRLAKDSDFDDKDNNEKLILPLEKAKWMLANDLLEAINLYFESLRF